MTDDLLFLLHNSNINLFNFFFLIISGKNQPLEDCELLKVVSTEIISFIELEHTYIFTAENFRTFAKEHRF